MGGTYAEASGNALSRSKCIVSQKRQIIAYRILSRLKFDPITDPLGICGVPPVPGNGAIPATGGTPGGTLKRRASEDGAVPPAKKFVLAYVSSGL